MNNRDSITHKELLTFSNLTNLEWEFADLEPSEEVDEDGNIYYEYTPLNDLLTPEVFVRIDEEKNEFGDNVTYIYGERDQNGEHIKETGLVQMRKKSGIAMEYLEKDEGSFLKDWEVIYGADRYQVIADYLDSVQEFIGTKVDYPSREDIADNEKAIQRLETMIRVIEVASYLIPVGIEIGVNGTSTTIFEKGFKGAFKESMNPNVNNVMKQVASRASQKPAYWALAPLKLQ